MILAIDAVQRLQEAGNELNTALEFYTIWGRDLGLALDSPLRLLVMFYVLVLN